MLSRVWTGNTWLKPLWFSCLKLFAGCVRVGEIKAGVSSEEALSSLGRLLESYWVGKTVSIWRGNLI